MLTIENNQKTVHVASSGQALLRYQADTIASKPHFDRVCLPPTAGARAGENIVLAAPHDHIWHLGLFFAQKYVDGLNFWESEYLATLGERYGECRNSGAVQTSVHDDGSVSLRHDIRWRTSDDQTWLTEQREIVVREPKGDAYRIDWKMAWTPVGKDRVWTSTCENGDYAGLSFRSPRSMDGAYGQVLNSEGASTIETVHGQPARWCDYTGKLDGKVDFHNPDKAGVTIFDHPQNHDHPNIWFAITKPFGFIASNLTYGKTWTMKQGEPVTVRFGVLIHVGGPDRARIESEYAAFAAWL